MAFVLADVCSFEEEVRKSRFLAFAAPVNNTQAAQSFIAQHVYPNANHHCWAWRIGQNYRFHDDGEPGGTAGRPILQAIEGQNIDYVVVLVARWFGGIKLGTGGLARAYGGTAAQCLRLGAKTEWVPSCSLACWCPFTDMALVRGRLGQFNANIESEQFDAHGVTWRLSLPQAQQSEFCRQFTNWTKGKGQVTDP
ncbi:MAG: YigZ family protein [Pusillimonas sp.]|nr:YigZ family protein [Pusillimonas sp.]